ncbi:hypothetical protein EYV94_04725 [Puteibacter caeruleilacunae]|nr:hypothetical protein EYV94_04725 [Puteibacter caeruleilacunae]
MKLFFSIVIFSLSILISNQGVQAQNNAPKSMLVIDTTKYPVDPTMLAKLDPGWIERVEISNSKEAGKSSIMLMYIKKEFSDKALLIAKNESESLIFKTVESFPEFEYDDKKMTADALEDFFRQNYQMPKELKGNGYSGRIYIKCIVERDGSLSEVIVNRGIDKTLDESVKTFIVEKMPPWIPAKIKNEGVRYRNIFPVNIKWLYGEVK